MTIDFGQTEKYNLALKLCVHVSSCTVVVGRGVRMGQGWGQNNVNGGILQGKG